MFKFFHSNLKILILFKCNSHSNQCDHSFYKKELIYDFPFKQSANHSSLTEPLQGNK